MASVECLKKTIKILYWFVAICVGLSCGTGVTMMIWYSHYSEVYSLFKGISVTLIVVGILTMVAYILGLEGAKRESLVLLILVAASLCVFLLIFLILMILSGVALSHTSSIKKDMYKSLDTDKIKTFWDYYQEKEECCGVDSASDWTTKNIAVPDSCCNQNAGKKGRQKDNDLCTGTKKYLHNIGCSESFQHVLMFIFGIATFELVCNIILGSIYAAIIIWLILKIKQRAE